MNGPPGWAPPVELPVEPPDATTGPTMKDGVDAEESRGSVADASPGWDPRRAQNPTPPVTGPVELPAEKSLSELEAGSPAEEGGEGGAEEPLEDGGAEEAEAERSGAPGWRRPGRWFWSLASLFLAGVLLQDLMLFLSSQYHRHPLLGGGFTVLAGGALGFGLVWLGREYRAWRGLRSHFDLAREARRLRRRQGFGEAPALLRRIAALYRGRLELEAELAGFFRVADDSLGDREMLTLFSNNVLRPLDDRAVRIITGHAASAGLLTALSPFALVDAGVFIWRNAVMVRQLGRLYGLRPGSLGSWELLKKGFQGLLAAGGSELLLDQAGDALGGSVAAVLLSRGGQGVTNGLFTARVGLAAMRLCRPIPFDEANDPGLARIRKELSGALARMVKGGQGGAKSTSD